MQRAIASGLVALALVACGENAKMGGSANRKSANGSKGRGALENAVEQPAHLFYFAPSVFSAPVAQRAWSPWLASGDGALRIGFALVD